MRNIARKVRLTTGITAAAAGLVAATPARSFEAPHRGPAVFSEQNFTPDVAKLAGAVIGLCGSGPHDVTNLTNAVQCDIELPRGAWFSGAVTSERSQPSGAPAPSAPANVEINIVGDPLSANQRITYALDPADGKWSIYESAAGYTTAFGLADQAAAGTWDPHTGALRDPQADEAVLTSAWRDTWNDTVAELNEAKAALGERAAGVAIPPPYAGPNVCYVGASATSVCS